MKAGKLCWRTYTVKELIISALWLEIAVTRKAGNFLSCSIVYIVKGPLPCLKAVTWFDLNNGFSNNDPKKLSAKLFWAKSVFLLDSQRCISSQNRIIVAYVEVMSFILIFSQWICILYEWKVGLLIAYLVQKLLLAFYLFIYLFIERSMVQATCNQEFKSLLD